MPKPSDRVQVAKYEVAADGGDPLDDEMGFPTAADSTEDGLQAAGVFFGESGKPASDELVATYRESDELFFCDSNNASGVSLSSLGGLLPLEDLVYTTDKCVVVVGCDFVTTS